MLGLGLVMDASLGMDVHNIAITFEMLLAAALMVGYYLLTCPYLYYPASYH